jgi:hypothetical protein
MVCSMIRPRLMRLNSASLVDMVPCSFCWRPLLPVARAGRG